MRRTVGIRLPNAAVSNVTRQTLIPFSTSSGDGGGRGRGRGGGPFSIPGSFNVIGKAPGESSSEPPKPDSPVPPVSGRGHGRGKPLPSASPLPGFSSFVASIKPPSAGRGRVTDPVSAQPPADESRPPIAADSEPKKPTFFRREGSVSTPAPNLSSESRAGELEVDHKLPGNILSVLSGAGRGKPTKQPGPEAEGKEVNRHLRRQRDQATAAADSTVEKRPIQSREDAVKNARRFLSKDEAEGGIGGRGRGGFRGRGAFGRGRGRDRGRGRFRGRARDDLVEDAEDSYVSGLYLGDNADGEKLAKRLGPEMMNQLAEGFEEMADRVLPSPLDDELLDAFDINCAIEFEPEYLMGEFDRNPDIDEKPPIPLRDALEKMKPFLMAYENIQSQEEWEEIMEETMARVPLLKKIVDHYSGPDRVTAKKQQEELERVAKTLPQSAPSSVKQFTERAVLSLQSNPGWGFDKKCQFMDKLVWEVSQQYK